MKQRNRGFNTYQQSLFNKYEIDESYLQTYKQRRACIELLEKIDKNQQIDERKMLEKMVSAFQGTEICKKIASCVTIAALLVTLQTTPVMAQATTRYQANAAITNTEVQTSNTVAIDEDSYSTSKIIAQQQEVKNTSLHLLVNTAIKNEYEPIGANGVFIDEDSDVSYFPEHQMKTLTVIDTSLEDWQIIRDAVKEGEVLLLDSNEKPLNAILSKFETMGTVDCLNIVSHGQSGMLEFKNGVIDSNTLDADQENWSKLAQYMSKDGDIQLFGCNIAKGEEGKAFIEKLAQVTGADVAASVNPTGAEDKGGDWTLEAVTGDVVGNLPFSKSVVAQFLHLLELPSGNQTYNFSSFTDNNDSTTDGNVGDGTMENTFFSVSGTAGSDNNVNKVGSSAHVFSSSQGTVTIKVEADRVDLGTFELEDINLSNNDIGTDMYSINNVYITGHIAGGGIISSTAISINLGTTATGTDFDNLSVFDGKQLDYFVVHGIPYYSARGLMFNSFTVSNMTAPASANTAPVLGGLFTTDGAVDDNSDITPFSGVTVDDNDGNNVSVKITYTGQNGTISSPTGGLTKNGSGNYTLDSDTVANVKAKLQALVFTPTENQVASGSTVETTFTLTPNDGTADGTSNNTTKVTATSINDAPVASNHAFTTDEDTDITNGDLTAYVTDADTGATLTYSKVTGPSNGTVTVNPNGTFTYTPTANYSGSDSFTWKANDGTADSNTATATITVNNVNDAPTVQNSTKNGTEDTTLTFIDADFNGVEIYADEENNALSKIQIVSLPNGEHGILKLDSTNITAGQEINAGDLANITFVPVTNYNGDASFTWKASDGNSYSASAATMTLHIVGTNDAPVASNHAFITDEDTVITNGDLTAYVTDADSGATFTYSKVTEPSHGTVTVNANGTFTYTPTANYSGSDSFTWKVSDGTADSNTATATITVNNVNDAPTVQNSTKNGTEDTTLTFIDADFNGAGVYADEESNALSKIQIVSLPNAAQGVLKLGSTDVTAGQEINAADLGNITFVPSADFNGDTTFTWKASDGTSYSASAATMTLHMAAANDAPVASDHTFTADEDTPLNGSLVSYATDVDTGTLTYALVSGPSQGTLILNADGTFIYTPASNYIGSDSFTWKVNDGTADSNTATATITVNNVNDAPTIQNSAKNGTEDTALTFTLADFNGAGVYADEESDTLGKVQIVSLPDVAHGVLKLGSTNITAGQEINAADLGNITFVPAENFNGDSTFTWKASDGTSYSASAATMTLHIAAANDAPTASDHTFTADEDTALNGSLVSYATDVDTGTLTYAFVSGPSQGTLILNADGTFTYTPVANYAGSDSFTWKVNDGTLDSNIATATITVNNVNDAPTIQNSTKNGTEDTTLTFTAADFNGTGVYTDEESDTLGKVQIVSLPNAAHGVLKLGGTDITAGQEINAGDLANITFVPVADFNGDATFTWKASDGNSYSAVATMTLALVATNDVPGVPLNVTVTAGNAQATVSFSAPTDNGGASITKYIVTSDPAGIIVEGTSSPITVTGLTNGTAYTFKVKAVNSVGTGAESAVSATVTPQVSSSGGSSGGGGGTTPTSTGTVTVLVNGKSESAAEATTSKEGDKTVTTVVINEAKIEEKIKAQGNNAVVTIPVSNNSDVVVGQLNGQTVKNMEAKEAVLEIKTPTVTYTIPASQINISSVSQQIGSQIQLKDITVSVKVSEPTSDTVKVVENTAAKNSYQIVVQPVQFEINCTNAGKTVDVSRFNSYVERMVAIPTGVDPNKITTGIVLNADGTFSHVPTQVVLSGGKYYAKINSLTNSTYSVIWSPKTFKDVEKHWSKEAVNDMGSRLVVAGMDGENFYPDRNITRAEFASILVKGLGLMRNGTGEDTFQDVLKNNWYYDAVSIAYKNGLVSGITKQEFDPTEQITREQAMAMVARAMKLTGLNSDMTDEEINKQLSKFTDSTSASNYAESSIATCIKNEIVSGKSQTKVAPKDYITRAEVAAIMERLLQKSQLI